MLRGWFRINLKNDFTRHGNEMWIRTRVGTRRTARALVVQSDSHREGDVIFARLVESVIVGRHVGVGHGT